MCRKFECREDIHYKTQTGTSCEKCNSKAFRGFDSQPEGLGVVFFATGPDLGLIMYILTTLEFPTHYFDFCLLTTSVKNAKYYY